jgi:Fe-S oxidoreductase
VPRQILTAIPGIELVEMERNRETSFCCGGGGGNFATDLLSGQDGPACLRVREAYETGATILAVACPICTKMLSDALKTEGLEEDLRLTDISELAIEACK